VESESWLFVGRLRNRQLGIRLQFEEALDGFGADFFEMLFELGKFIVGDIDEWAFDALGASWQEADDAGEIHFRFLFTDASNDVGAVLGEVFVQERDGEFIELASRADGPAGTAGISDLERTRIGFPERCHGLLRVVRFGPI
jgi:hypothetical protein